MVMHVNGEMQKIETGAFVIFPPGSYMHYYPQTVDMLENWCNFEGAGLEEWIGKLKLPTNRPFYVQNTTTADDIFRILVTNWNNGNAEAASSGLYALLCYLSAAHQCENGITPNQKKLYNLRNMMRAYPEKDWNIANMAAFANYSGSYLNKMYREIFGISPKKDLFHARMEQAKYLLTTTSDSVENIANQLNYASSTSFITQFHKEVGVSPLQYRKKFSEK